MQTAAYWQTLFQRWPASLPRQGLVVTVFQEAIPFSDFLLSEGLLLLERDKPDSTGARKVILCFDAIAGVKITSTIELARFRELGFSPR
jgi:hypothetical protein